MIYCIDNDILDRLIEGTEVQTIEKLMQRLEIIEHSDYHYVSTNEPEFLKIINKCLLSIDRKSQQFTFEVLKHIEHDFSEVFSTLANVHPKVIIHIADNFSLVKSVNNDDIILNYNSSDEMIKFWEPTFLISENPTDGTLYETIGKSFFKSKFERLSTAFNVQIKVGNGGGGTIKKELKNEIFHNRQIVLCIVDSDRKSPMGEIGHTAQITDVKVILEDKSTILSGAYYRYVLPVHEKENLILPSEYLSLTKNEGNLIDSPFRSDVIIKLRKMSKIEREVDNHDNYYLDYYDWKNGVCTNINEDIYFNPLLEKYSELKSKSNSGQKTLGFGKNFLNDVNPNHIQIKWDVNNHLVNIRKKIGNLVIAFGFSSSGSSLL